MTVCVVAAFPWQSIAANPGLESPGIVVCSDTRITYGQRIGTYLLRKQSLVARNILVCYTSSHVEATNLAIRRSSNTKSVERIGKELKAAHTAHGGFTELIAVVWRASGNPQMLELMPPTYAPKQRVGIIGIGDPGSLDSFRQNFRVDLDVEPIEEGREQMAAAWQRQFGTELIFPLPSLPISTAATHIVGCLSGAIEAAGGMTVALPLQLMTISCGVVHQLQAHSSGDLKTWDEATTTHSRTKFAPGKPGVDPSVRERRSARQLFP